MDLVLDTAFYLRSGFSIICESSLGLLFYLLILILSVRGHLMRGPHNIDATSPCEKQNTRFTNIDRQGRMVMNPKLSIYYYQSDLYNRHF